MGAPGLAIESPAGGLGIISFAPNTQLQFGAQDPISVEEARRRVLLLEREQQEQQERLRQGSAPAGPIAATNIQATTMGGSTFDARGGAQAYPQHNLIPTTSDAGALREMMVQQQGRDGGGAGAGGGQKRVYPAANLIPTGSDAGALREMVVNGSRGGGRDGSGSGRVLEEVEEDFPPLPRGR